MKYFRYIRPVTLKDAIDFLARTDGTARPLLGGTDLMVRIQKGHIEVDAVVDLKSIADLSDEIICTTEKMRVGARAVMADLITHPKVRKLFPALVDAASVVGSVQIRNRATLSGNICNASPAADTVPVLMAYGASVVIEGPGGKREVVLRDFFTGPGKTKLGSGELVTSIELPLPEQPSGCSFGRLTRRKGVDLATVNIACFIDSEGVVSFVFGAAGPRPVFVQDKTGMLSNPDLDDEYRDRLLTDLISYTSPISDVRSGKEYRSVMLLTIGRKVLREAIARRIGGKASG